MGNVKRKELQTNDKHKKIRGLGDHLQAGASKWEDRITTASNEPEKLACVLVRQ